MLERLSQEEVSDFLYKNGLVLIGDYFNYIKKITVKDFEGYYYLLTLRDIKKAVKKNFPERISPLRFSFGNIYTLKNIKNWIKLNNSLFIFDGGEWNGNSEKTLFFKCKVCHEVWNMNWASIITGYGCPYCSGKRVGKNSLRNTNPKISEEWDYEKNGELTPDNVTHNSNKDVWWICEFGHEWKTKINARAGSVNRKGTGCPFCISSKKSKGEMAIQEFLVENKIKYECQKKFTNCKNLLPLPFDFYLPEYDFLIEFQGEQHYKVTRFWGMNKEKAEIEFEKVKNNDKTKFNFCKNKNIYLLIIPYWDFFNIGKILTKVLNL